MAMALPTDGGSSIILDDEIDGDEIGSRNYRFSKVGEPVPICSNASAEFDPKRLPSQPLAVSERFRLLFVAHPHGFCVARTSDVMVSAEQFADKQNGQSIKELCLLDVSIENVSILCLSSDNSMLAATVGSHAHIFSVNALLYKDQKPSFVVSLEGSHHIKEMRWSKSVAKDYVILSADGKLSYGSGQGPFSHVIESVDAVDWSVEGNFVVVAQKNRVAILSSELKEMLSFSLQFKSVLGDRDCDVNKVMKVDSVRWIRTDSIVVGCFELNDDGMEENYIVQVITSKEGRITDASSKWIVLSFNNVFVDFCPDTVPIKNGPHLFLSYFDLHELAIIANRNLSQHIGLFGWSLDGGKNEAKMIEILNDAWTLYISSQGNGEENVLLGFSIDKVSQNKNLKLTLGDSDTEVSPFCVIICLTIDGNISIFHFASAAGALLIPEVETLDERDLASEVLFEHNSLQIPVKGGKGSAEENYLKSESQMLSKIEREKTEAKANVSEKTSQESLVYSQTLKLDGPTLPLAVTSNQDGIKDNQLISKVKSSSESVSQKVVGDFSNQLVSRSNAGAKISTSPVGRSQSLPFSEVDGSNKFKLHASGSMLRNYSDFSEKAKRSTRLSGPGNIQPAHPVSQMAFKTEQSMKSEFCKDSFAAYSVTGLPNSYQYSSKHFKNVEEMAKMLDTLLEGIEGIKGFTDASITSQENMVVELEDYMSSLSKRCLMWRGLMDEQLRDAHLLLDKTVQVLVRKVYLEGIFKQDGNSRYWQLWNCQKLSSELELKRRHILDLNQELTDKLIELERHFNLLEFNTFGVNGALQSWRASQTLHGMSRKIQSLNNLHYTMNAQLAAAEQLSGCLSKQMAALSIKSCGEKHDAKKKLFESIGLSYPGDSSLSPPRNRIFDTLPYKEQFTGSSSFAVKRLSKINQGNSSSYEPETARRHRDSLDQSWASFEPPRTTLKRMLLKEDHKKGSSNQSKLNIDENALAAQSQKKLEVANPEFLDAYGVSLNFSKNKGSSEILAKEFNERSTSLFQRKSDHFDFGRQELSMKEGSVLPPPSIPKSKEMTHNNELGSLKLYNEKLRSSKPSSEKNNSFAERESNAVQQLNSNFNQRKSILTCLAEDSLTPSSDSMGSSDRFRAEFMQSASGDSKNELTLADNTCTVSNFPLIPAPLVISALNETGRDLSEKSSNGLHQLGDNVPTNTSLQSTCGSSSPKIMLPPLSSALSFSAPESNLSLKSESSHLAMSEFLKSSTTLPVTMHGSKPEAVLQTQASSVGSLSLTEKNADVQASSSQFVLETPLPISKLGSLPSSTRAQLSTNTKSVNEIDIAVSSIHSSIATSICNFDGQNEVEATGEIVGNVQNLLSDSSQEEEMEEEASEISQISEIALGNLGGFGTGSTPGKANPFGLGSLNNKELTSVPSQFTLPAGTSNSGLFQPAYFNYQSPQPPEAARPTTINPFAGGFSAGNLGQISSVGGFGQPAHIGSGQQAIGSMLGAFGQSRQLGAGPMGSNVTGKDIGGGFLGNSVNSFGGGFASASTFGGFATLAAGGGGFASSAIAGGQFAAAASSGVGFASTSVGGSFAAFSNPQGIGGLSAFSSSGTTRPPSELITQMRK